MGEEDVEITALDSRYRDDQMSNMSNAVSCVIFIKRRVCSAYKAYNSLISIYQSTVLLSLLNLYFHRLALFSSNSSN